MWTLCEAAGFGMAIAAAQAPVTAVRVCARKANRAAAREIYGRWHRNTI